jgi:hypothetical protein
MDKTNKEELIKTIEEQIQQTLPEGITINTVKNNLLILDCAKKYDKVTLTDGRIGEFVKLIKNYKFLIKINGLIEEVYVYQFDKLEDNLNRKTFIQKLSSGKLIFLLGFILFLAATLAGMRIITTFTFLLIMAFAAIINGAFMIPVAGREFKEEKTNTINTYERLKNYTLEELITNKELSKDLNDIKFYQLKNIINGGDK